VRASFAGRSSWLGFVLLALLVVAFIAFASTTTGMVFGSRRESAGSLTASSQRVGAVPLVAGLGLLLLLGIWIPGGLNELILHSMRTIV
jgi:hypothetical protein